MILADTIRDSIPPQKTDDGHDEHADPEETVYIQSRGRLAQRVHEMDPVEDITPIKDERVRNQQS